MEISQARESLRSIDEAKAAAARSSQNNGAVLLVWGTVVAATMAGFDFFPALAARCFGADEALIYGPIMSAVFLLPVIIGAGAWTQRYVKHLPVAAREPGNRWLFVTRSGGGAIPYGKGWWTAYHLAVICAGMGLIAWAMSAWHRDTVPPFAFTIIGVVDAAPLLAVGWAQRQKLRSYAEAS